jgi:hypothetical protein
MKTLSSLFWLAVMVVGLIAIGLFAYHKLVLGR